MSGSCELLESVYQGARMGQEAIVQLQPYARRETAFRRHLDVQLAEYSGIVNEAYNQLRDRGQEAEDIGAGKKLMSRASVKGNMIKNRSEQHMAEMMIQGSTMGVVKSIGQIRRYEPIAEEPALNLARKLLNTEEANIQQLKAFL